MKSQARLVLKPGREKSILKRHPWVFSGAVSRLEGSATAGDSIRVCSATGQTLARATYHPKSQIVARIYSLDPEQDLDSEWLLEKMSQSFARRQALIDSNSTDMYRLIAHEADGIPGLVVDCYQNWLSLQILNSAMERRRDMIVKCLQELRSPDGIIERSDEAIRKKEGLQPLKQLLTGQAGDQVLPLTCQEHHVNFEVDLWNGHKTGFYLDQRDNRAVIRDLSQDRRVLNNFSYTGGFSLAALAGGAREVLSVDTSQDALNLANRNAQLNGWDDTRHTIRKADVFTELRRLDQDGERFDLIILDPPKFVSSQKNLQSACRGYQDLNRLALKLLNPGGTLASFSCSGLLSPDLFWKIIFSASLEAECELELKTQLKQASDHPILFHLPESYYLKGFVCDKR